MRLTPVRENILSFLTTQRIPVSLETVTEAPAIRGSCNTATIYRTLMLFRELEVIRQVSLPNKISYFVLNVPGQSGHFLICRCCGQISQLPATEYLAKLEQEIAHHQGYARLYYELEFFRICPKCQKHPAGIICAKVQPRMRINTGSNLLRTEWIDSVALCEIRYV